GAGAGSPRPTVRRRCGKLLSDATRRRYGFRQNRGLLRGRRQGAGAEPASADHAAGNRTDEPVPQPLLTTLWLQARRVAFGACLSGTWKGLAGRGNRRGAGRRRSVLGPVPALP